MLKAACENTDSGHSKNLIDAHMKLEIGIDRFLPHSAASSFRDLTSTVHTTKLSSIYAAMPTDRIWPIVLKNSIVQSGRCSLIMSSSHARYDGPAVTGRPKSQQGHGGGWSPGGFLRTAFVLQSLDSARTGRAGRGFPCRGGICAGNHSGLYRYA